MEKGTLLYIYKHFVGPNKSSTWFEQCNMQGIPSCWNSLCNYFRSSATIGHVGYFWYCRNGINIVPITPGILYSYTNLNKSWRTHSVIERSLPTFSENPRVEVLEVGRNWSLFIANEVNDPPKNMSRILRISSTTWNMTHLCSTPHGAFYVWTRMARVQKMDDILYFMYFFVRPAPPPNPKKNQLQITEVFKYARTGTWTCVARITWLHKKNTYHFFPASNTRFLMVFVSATAHSWISSSCQTMSCLAGALADLVPLSQVHGI